jgi:hypothetical protein
MRLEPGGIVLVTLSGVTFEDGHRWQAPTVTIERANGEAIRVAALTERP